MGNASTFFRVFDLAFFAPGLVVLVPLWRWWDLELGRANSTNVLDAAVGAALWFLVAYGIGLVIQGLSRVVLHRSGPAKPADDEGPIWLSVLSPGKREDMLLYFWYMRATCFNIALATPIAVVLWLTRRWDGPWVEYLGAAGALLAAALLWSLGRSFEVAWRRARALGPVPPEPAAPHPPAVPPADTTG